MYWMVFSRLTNASSRMEVWMPAVLLHPHEEPPTRTRRSEQLHRCGLLSLVAYHAPLLHRTVKMIRCHSSSKQNLTLLRYHNFERMKELCNFFIRVWIIEWNISDKMPKFFLKDCDVFSKGQFFFFFIYFIWSHFHFIYEVSYIHPTHMTATPCDVSTDLWDE